MMRDSSLSSIMKSPNEFWLTVNQLVQAFEAEGIAYDERLSSIVDEWERMPPAAREAVLEDARHLATMLPHLCIKIRDRVAERDQGQSS